MLTEFNILNIGIKGLPEQKSARIRLLNLMSAITTVVAFIYIIFYICINEIAVAATNFIAICLYLTTFYLTHRKQYRLAKLWIFSAYILNFVLLTLVGFTEETGYNFYFLILPHIAFLVFEHEDIKEKICMSAIPLILFFICGIVEIDEPYVKFSQFTSQVLYFSSITTAFMGGLLVTFIFTHNIKKYENEQQRLIHELQSALSEVKTLKGFLPICSSCKKIRDDKGYWNQIESYIQERSDAEFSHSMCPDCSDSIYGREDWYIELKKTEQLKKL